MTIVMGNRLRSKKRDCAMIPASTNPSKVPIIKPDVAVITVDVPCAMKKCELPTRFRKIVVGAGTI